LSIYADTYGTGKVHESEIEKAIEASMDLTPKGIRQHLGMNRPIYQRTAAYGHFGRAPDADGGFSWEKTDLVETLKIYQRCGHAFGQGSASCCVKPAHTSRRCAGFV